jgi:hypothetical protein
MNLMVKVLRSNKMGREDEIRLIAYSIWEQERRLDGHDWEHWYKAEIIWEEQNQKADVKSAKIESKQPVKQEPKLKTNKKKFKNT